MSKPITDDSDKQIDIILIGVADSVINIRNKSLALDIKIDAIIEAKAKLQNRIKAARVNELKRLEHCNKVGIIPKDYFKDRLATLNSEEQYHCGNPICSKLHKTKELDAKCRAHASEDGVQG